MGTRLRWDRAHTDPVRRSELPMTGVLQKNRRMRTTLPQKHVLLALAWKLGREPEFPEWAYDARVEIQRLRDRLATKERLGV